MEITRHFTVTTTIVHKNKVLLHFHKKLKKWLPVGGHIDRDELPEEAAIREAREEAGLDIILYNPDKNIQMDGAKDLIRPSHIMLQDINNFHQHIDFTYYAMANTFELHPGSEETNELEWFTPEEIKKLDIPQNVKVRALEALELLSS
jgi:8-oxo-dGTP pyrophosphatase MutT (NUDIX family)